MRVKLENAATNLQERIKNTVKETYHNPAPRIAQIQE